MLDDEPLRPIAGSRGSYLVWDATGRELWERALLSTTHRLPVREHWTHWPTLRVTEVT